jgi:hypothetical protein
MWTVDITKRSWTCPRCLLVFSRRWNLQRHLKLMHSVHDKTGSVDGALKVIYNNKPKVDNPLSIIQETLKQVSDFVDLQNKITNSRQISDHRNLLEWQVSSLNQQLASCQQQLSDLLSNNWIFSKGAIQGISGYVCKICRTFSLKPVIDPGYDMTMEKKHRCLDSPNKRSYIVLPIPSDIPDVDHWTAQTLLNQVNFYFPIGKYFIAKDITEAFIYFSDRFNPEIAREALGIPDEYYCHTLENNSKINWINRAIYNLGKKIILTDDEALDFFRRVKSTYAIFDVPIDGTRRQFFMTFTNY